MRCESPKKCPCEFVHRSRGIPGSHYQASLKPQCRILFLHEPGGVPTMHRKAALRPHRHDRSLVSSVAPGVSSRSPRVRPPRCVPESVNSVTTADRDFDSPNQYVCGASQDWRNRGLWYSHTGQQGMLADLPKSEKSALTTRGLRLLWETPFEPLGLRAYFRPFCCG